MFDNNTIAIESFITFCDDMMIAEESFSSIKSKIVTLFSRLVLWIESKVKKMKDGKIKFTLMKLLSRAKKGLSKSKSLNEHNLDMVRELQEEYNEINEEIDAVEIGDSVKTSDKDSPFVEKKDGKTIHYERDGKTIAMIDYPDGKQEVYRNGKLHWINYDHCPSEKTLSAEIFEEDGVTCRARKFKDGRKVRFEDDHLVYQDFRDCPSEKNWAEVYFELNFDESALRMREDFSRIIYKDGRVMEFRNGKPYWESFDACPSEKRYVNRYDENGKLEETEFKDGHVEEYINGKLRNIDYSGCKSEKLIRKKIYEDDGKRLKTVEYKDGRVVHYKNGKPVE